MRRRAEEEELRGADTQQVSRPRRLRRARDEGAQHIVDLAEPAKRRRDQKAGEGAIARGQAIEPQMAGEGLIEGLAAVEDAIQDIERNPPRSWTSWVGGACRRDRSNRRLIGLPSG
jgi:hypothetical protein